MKCLNCGFESNNPFCPMCGAKMAEQDTPQAQNNAENTQNNNPEVSNTYFDNAQQDIPVYPQQNMPPQPPVYTQPPAYSQPNMPVPPQYIQPERKKSSKALPIILTCIIIAVVIAGVVISICSSYMFNKSIFEAMSGVGSHTNVYDSDIYDSYGYNTEFDDTVHKKGEVAKYENFNITLKDAKISDMESDDSMQMCSFTFEIENTSNEGRNFFTPCLEFEFVNDKDNYDCTYEWLYDDIKLTEDYEFYVGAGEKSEFTTHYKVSKDSTPSYNLELNITDATEFTMHDVYSKFKVDLATED